MSTTYVSLEEAARLELEGARRRLGRAQAAIDEFHLAHGNPRLQMRAESFAHQEALLREYHGLLIEHDDAARNFQKNLADWAAVKGK